MRFKSQTAVHLQSTYMEMDVSNGITASYLSSNDWTISFWAYIPNIPDNTYYILKAANSFWMYYRGLSDAINVRISETDTSISQSYFQDKWTHFTISWDGSTVKIYLDNTERGSFSKSSLSLGTAESFKIGGDAASANFPSIKFSQFTFHNKALSDSERLVLYNETGYEDLSGQQKLDLSILAWNDFMNDSANSQYGKNYNGGSADYNFTAGNYSNTSLVGGNFVKGITKRTGDRISQITSADANSLTLTADTTDLIYVPRYRIRNATTNNSKPVINFNQNNATITNEWGNDNEDTGQEQHFLLNTEELNGKDLTIIIVHRESNHGGIGTILASKGTNDAESKELWLYSEGGKHKFAYGGTVQAAVGHDTMNQGFFNLVVYKLTEAEIKIQHRILHPSYAIKTNTNSLSFSRQTLTNNQISIGARMVSATTHDKKFGEIAELMLFDRALSNASISTISQSLVTKYQSNP